MTSLLIHAALGVLTLLLYFVVNHHLYARGGPAAGRSWPEALFYVFAVGSVCAGWYFNVQYMQAYADEASWWHFTKLLFTNPAAGSGSQDLITANVFLFPLWTVIDGPRRGLKHCWLYFAMSLVTSFGFAMALYLAAQERQVRWNAAQARA